MKLIITIEARQDIADAYDWYEEQKQGLGEQFLKQFRITCNDILIAPTGYQHFHHYRQIPLYLFPYVILYEIIEENIVVFAIFNTHQHPRKKKR